MSGTARRDDGLVAWLASQAGDEGGSDGDRISETADVDIVDDFSGSSLFEAVDDAFEALAVDAV